MPFRHLERHVNYASLVRQSFLQLEQNPVLFAPNGLALAASLLLALGFLYFSGILRVIIMVSLSLAKVSYFASALYALITANPLRFWSVTLLYLAAEFFVSLFFVTAKYGMIKEVILRGKTTLQQGFAFGKRHLFDVTRIYLASLLIIMVPVIALFLLGLLLMPSSLLGGVLVLGLFTLFGLLYAMFIIYRLIFVYPVMAFEREGPMKSIKDDFHYVKTHLGHTFITWIVLAAIGAVYLILQSPLSSIRTVVTNGYLVIGVTGAIILLEALVSTWEHIFVFKTYLAGKNSADQRSAKF